jgi:hypothetical protein
MADLKEELDGIITKMEHRINTRAENVIFIVQIKRGKLYFTGPTQGLSYSVLRHRSGC